VRPHPRKKKATVARAELQLIAHRKPSRPTLENLTPEVERTWFQFDRDAVLRQLDELRKAIGVDAKELGMVAVEGVFEPPLAADLLRTSRSLQLVAKQIGDLWSEVSRASGYPKGKKKLV
jgi:hypothetical protein